MRRIILGLVVSSCLFAVTYAEEIPVNIKADTLKYISGTELVEAIGSVEVKLKAVTIFADHLLMHSGSSVVTAEGRVKLQTNDYTALASRLVYDASAETAVYRDFSSGFLPGKVKGPVYVTAQEIKDLKTFMPGEQGTVSTCDYGQPHYLTYADRIEYFPDDKIIGHNTRLVVGDTTVLWLPYMYYDLKGRQKRNWTFGHNNVEGDYIKSAWAYPLGLLYLDLMEKKGFGLGTRDYYQLLGLGGGLYYLYHLEEKDTGLTDWVTRIEHEKQINPHTKLKLKQELLATYLIPSGRRDQTSLNLDLSYQNQARWHLNFNSFDDRAAALQKYTLRFNQAYQGINTDYSLTHDLAKNNPKWQRDAQSLNFSRPLWGSAHLNSRINYSNFVADEGQSGDERLEPQIEIRGNEDWYSWAVRENWVFDPDGNLITTDNSYQYLEKLPEIEITPRPIDLRFFNLSPGLSYGRLHEVRYVPQLTGNRDYTTEKYTARLNASQTIPLALGTAAVLGAGLDQYLYGPGDQLYAYRESLSLNTNLGGFFRHTVNYSKGLTEGNTPFLFDQVGTRYHNLAEQMTFDWPNKFTWNINGGFNWQTSQWYDVLTDAALRPNTKLAWRVNTGWDIENRRYKDLVNNLSYNPYSYLGLTLAVVSDLNDGKLRTGSLIYDWFFLENQPNQWHFRLSQIYESASDQFKVRDIMVVKELHCWDLKYTYSDYRQEFTLTLSLKAMPDEPIGISSGRGFYVEGFEKQVKELKPEGAIQRY